MVAIKNVLVFVSAAAALTIGKRDQSTVLSNILTIDTNVQSPGNTVNDYNGGVFAAIPVTSAESKLDKSIKQEISDAQATRQLSSDDSNSIVTSIQNLILAIESTLSAVKNKKSKFASAGLAGTVQKDPVQLKSDTDSFGMP